MIVAKNLSVIYPDCVYALDGVSFNIAEGEHVAIVGANGAGKSTLLLAMVGIVRLSSGELRVGDIELSDKNLPLIREKLGLLFQNPDDQLFMPTIYDDVAFGLQNRKVDAHEVSERVNSTLETLNIAHLSAKQPMRLSGGEKRIAALATIIAMEPQLLLMDEPSSYLDPAARETLIALLKGLPHAQLIATHDLDLALDVCSRVLVLTHGKLAIMGDAQEILTDKKMLESCGLRLPLSIR
ncbi:ABC transporter ATP-binding protein [Deferribacterales bacterium RsTz2092]|nr:putative ABC transporter ATP-binding protein [Deferribacterales bacterium]